MGDKSLTATMQLSGQKFLISSLASPVLWKEEGTTVDNLKILMSYSSPINISLLAVFYSKYVLLW